MCITFWGRLPFGMFVACNRDEYINRPTAPSNFWNDCPDILAGRDLSANGTWLGLNVKTGKLAFLTNLRAKTPPPDLKGSFLSRGNLVTDFLKSSLSPEAYIQSLDASRYHGFNLVCIDFPSNRMAYTNNLTTIPGSNAASDVQRASCGSSPQGQCLSVAQSLEPNRLYGLSNGLLDEWPKVTTGINAAQELLQQYQEGCLKEGKDARSSIPWDALFDDLLGDTRRDESLAPQQLRQQGHQGSPSHGAEPLPQPAPSSSASSSVGVTADSAGSPMPSGQGLNADDHLEYVSSARFIPPLPSKFGPFGTRSQIVIVIWEDGTGELRERYLEPEAGTGKHVWKDEKHTFALELSS